MSGQMLQAHFQIGLQEGIDPKNAPMGTLLVAENVRMDKAGRLRKRRGTVALPKTINTGGTISSGLRLLTDGNQIGLIDGTNTQMYNAATSQWRTIDRVPALRATWKPFIDTVKGAADCTTAIYNDTVLVAAYTNTGGTVTSGLLCIEAMEIATGASVLARTVISTNGAYPKLLIRGTSAVVLWMDALNGFRVVEVNLLTGVVGTPVTLVASAGGVFAAQMVGTTLYTACSATAVGLRADAWNAASSYANLVTQTVQATAATYSSIAINATAGENFYIAFSSNTAGIVTSKLAVLNPSTLAITQAATAITDPRGATYNGLETWSITRFDATHALIAVGLSVATRVSTWVISNTAVNTAATERSTFNARLIGDFWTTGGRYYLPVSDEVYSLDATIGPSPTHVIAEVETSSPGGAIPHRIVAVIDPYFAGRNSIKSNIFYTTQSPTTSFGRAIIALPQLDKQRNNPNELVACGFSLVTLDTIDTTSDLFRPSVSGVGDILAVAGGSFWYDANITNYLGFLHPPQLAYISTATTGGSMAAGTYQYLCVYEYLDAKGVLHRSPPSLPKSITTTGTTSTVTFNIHTAGLSCRQSIFASAVPLGPVRIAIYRTTANGTQFYRLSHDPDLNQVLDTGNVQTIAFTDTVADGAIGTSGGANVALANQPQVYTAGQLGELPDDFPPALITAIRHGNRIVGLAGDSRTVWISKDRSVNPGIAPGFSVGLTATFGQDKTTLASLDEKIVVFGNDNIDIIEGDGSPPSGVPYGWSTRRIQTDVGCTNARSVVVTPDGVMFYSQRGALETLDRNLNVDWTSRPVQDELQNYPNVTSGVLYAIEHEVRWTCNNAANTAGIVLVYDYVNKAWMTRKYYDVDTANASTPFVDSAVINGVYTLLTAGGRVYQESQTSFLDAGTQWVTLHVETAPISPAGSLAWHSIKSMGLLGTSNTHHDLILQVGKDFKTLAGGAWMQTHRFIAGSDVTGAPSTLESIRVTHKSMKAQSVRYYIADAPPSNTLPVTTGEGPMLEGFGIMVRPKAGFPRRSATREA